MSELIIIDSVVNMYHSIYTGRSLYKLMSIYLRDGRIQNPVRDLRWSTLEK